MRYFVGVFVVSALLAVAPAAPQDANVVIEGGRDADGNYAWTVTNRGERAIVQVTFPHYQADLFSTPDGWEQECTFLVNVGVPDEVGTCIATAPSAAAGIQPARSANFQMRIMNNPRAVRGTGIVAIEFANGDRAQISGVEIPVPPSQYEPIIMLAGFGLLILLFILFRPKKKEVPEEEPAAE